MSKQTKGNDVDVERILREKWHVPKFENVQASMKKSKRECPHLSKMNDLTLVAVYTLIAFSKLSSFFNENRVIAKRYSNSLIFHRLFELIRISLYNVFLSGGGFYRSAYNNIRYFLESAIQTFYIELKHEDSNIFTKIEILKEVEDKAEYRGVRLIRKLEIDYRKDYRKIIEMEYKRLSKEIHASHWQVFATMSDIQRGDLDIRVDCEEVSNIYSSMRIIYDIFFFLFLKYFSEVIKPLLENRDFVEVVKDHDLKLVSKVLNI